MASLRKHHSHRGHIITEKQGAMGVVFLFLISGSTFSVDSLEAAKKLIDDTLKRSGKIPLPDEPGEETPPHRPRMRL